MPLRLRIGALVVLLLASMASAQDDAARKAEEAEARGKLEQVRAQIARESIERGSAQQAHAEANAALRDIELAVGAAARTVAQTEAELQSRESELLAAQAERADLEKRLGGQRLKLGSLLRSAYLIGRDAHLRAWLARDRLGPSSRALAYARYLQQDRLDRMRSLLDELAELTALTRDIESAKLALAERRARSQLEIDTLGARRAEREALIAKLDVQLADHRQRLQAYARDEQSMLSLLDRLRDVLSDIPRQLNDAEPIARQRGRLPWPLPGKVLTAFGSALDSGRLSDGVVIAAQTGDPVQAVAHGRVAYADWLRGFGLLVIVDHGDGFMSLYAHNEALLRDEGDWVQTGTVLAKAGASGGSEQTGLYFELRRNSQPLDPKGWLRKRP